MNAGEAIYGVVGADLLSFCRREKWKEVGKQCSGFFQTFI